MDGMTDLTGGEFLKTRGGSAAGLLIGFYLPLPRLLHAQEQPAAKLPPPNAFLHIGTDESITVLLAHSEMGQGIWTTLPMLLAEELDCDWSKIHPEHAPAEPVYAHTALGIQMTGGSTTTWSEYDRYRQVRARARARLRPAAAKQWGGGPQSCPTGNGVAIPGTEKTSDW